MFVTDAQKEAKDDMLAWYLYQGSVSRVFFVK